MKYRIREDVYGNSSSFFTERWHEPYQQWVVAMYCRFDSLKDAKEGLDFYSEFLESCKESTLIHEYEPKRWGNK